MNNMVIALTPEQLEQITPLLQKIKNGGAVFGQVYKDGIHAFLLSPERTQKLCIALQDDPHILECLEDRLCSTAQQAFDLAKEVNGL